MLTLNQIIAQIQALAAAHAQIASSGVGTLAEWQANPDRQYPLLWLFHERTDVNDSAIIHRIRLMAADRVKVGESGEDNIGHEQEVLSDMLSVLLDFIAYFAQQHGQSYIVERSGSIEPFTERGNDRVAGVSYVLNIRQPIDFSKCQIPQSGATIPPSVDGLTLYDFCDPAVIARLTPAQVACLEAEFGVACDPVTLTINGTSAGSEPSGGEFNINVTLDGSPAGSWDGVDTWEVTSDPCADATANLINTVPTLISSTPIASGASANITAPDATAVLKDTGGVTLSTTAIPSNVSQNITAPDGTVLLDGAAYGSVVSGGSINVNSQTYSRLPSKTWRFCYADRGLISGYTGALMQCRKATGGSTFDAVQDANGYMDTVAVVLARGNDNITTPIVYDQAGSGIDLLQAVVANQPRLAVGSPNGKDKATIYHAQTPFMQAAHSFALNSTETVYLVGRPNTINGALVCGSGTSWLFEMAGSNTVYVFNGVSYFATTGAVQLYSPCLLTLQLKLNALIVRINGVQILSQNPFALAASTSVTVAARSTGANPNNLGWQALLAHAGDFDASVESALMAAYKI